MSARSHRTEDTSRNALEGPEMTFWNRIPRPDGLNSFSDERLCHEVRAGSHDAFLVLFDRHWVSVFRLAKAVLRDEAEAEDLAQTLFLEVHTSLLQYKPEKGSFRTLLLRYAYTRAIDQRRKLETRRFYSNVTLEAVTVPVLKDTFFSFGLSIEEATLLIETGMQQLDERQRVTLEAYFFQGLSLQEIARELGDSFGNTRHHLYRGIANMRKFLTPEHSRKREADGKDRSTSNAKVTGCLSEVSVVRPPSV